MGHEGTGRKRYDAFISYSHSADGRLAPAVQAGLQRLARPWYRIRALRVFRDETGLAVNPHLWTSISQALDDSEYFVLLASPDAAASPWVGREIEAWLATRSPERILPVLTDGELVWDAAAGRYDPVASTALPPALAAAIRTEPRHLDLRWARTDDQLGLRNAGFRAAIADLAAPMHGVSREDLEGEDVRQHRRAMRFAWGGAALLALVTVLAVAAAVFAVQFANRAQANERRAVAERERASENAVNAAIQRNRALNNQVRATRAQERAEANAEQAAASADDAVAQRSQAEANAADATRNAVEARTNGARAEEKSREAQRNAEQAQASASQAAQAATDAQRNADAAGTAAAEADHQRAAAELQRAAAEAAKAQAEQSERTAQKNATVARARQLAASALNVLPTNPDRALVMAVQARRLDDNAQTRGSLLRTLQRQPAGLVRFLTTAGTSTDPVDQVVTSLDGRVAAAITRQGTVSIHSVPAGRVLAVLPIPTQPFDAFRGAVFSPDGTRVASATDGTLRVWESAGGQLVASATLPGGRANAVAFAPDGSRVAAVASGQAVVFDSASGDQIGPTVSVGGTAHALALDASGSRLAVAGFGGSTTQTFVRVYAAGTGAMLADLPGDNGGPVGLEPRGALALRFESPDALTLVPMGTSDEALISWDLATGQRVRDVPTSDALAAGSEVAVAVDRGLDTVVTSSSRDGEARVRDLTSGALIGSPLGARLGFCPPCGMRGGSTRGAGFGPATTVLAAGSDGLVRALDFGDRAERLTSVVAEHSPAATSVFSRDGSTVVRILDSWTEVAVLDAHTGALRRTIAMPDLPIEHVAVSPDGAQVVITASGFLPDQPDITSDVSLWDVESGAQLWSRRNELLGVSGVAFDRSGSRLALTGSVDPTFERSVVAIWDPRTGTGTGVVSAPGRASLSAPEFSPDGTSVWVSRVADAALGTTMIAYDTTTGTLVRSLDDPRLSGADGLRFSADGSAALSVDSTAQKLNVLDGTTLALRREIAVHEPIQSAAISRDGTMVALTVGGGRSVLFAADTGEQLSDPIGPDLAHAAHFATDGGYMLVAARDAVVRVDVDPDSWSRAACDVANRNLSIGEWTDLLGASVPYAATCVGAPGPR